MKIQRDIRNPLAVDIFEARRKREELKRKLPALVSRITSQIASAGNIDIEKLENMLENWFLEKVIADIVERNVHRYLRELS